MGVSLSYYPSAKGSTVEMVREFISTKVSVDSWSEGEHYFVYRPVKWSGDRLSDQVEEVSEKVWKRLCFLKGTLVLPILSEAEYNQLSGEQKLNYIPKEEYGRQIMSEEEAYDNGCSPFETDIIYHPYIGE